MMNINRVVFIPSFRGIGVTKALQDRITDYVFKNTDNHKELEDIYYLEISSIMLHNFDFSASQFNKFYVNLKKYYTEDEIKYIFRTDNKSEVVEKKGNGAVGGFRNGKPKGFKGTNEVLANLAFCYNKKYKDVLFEYYNKFYNVDKSLLTDELFSEPKVSFENYNELSKQKLPVILLNIMSVNELKKLSFSE